MVEIEAAQEILVGFAFAGCCVTTSPGTTSSASPTRENGLALTCSPLTVSALAALGCRPGPSSGAPAGVDAVGGVAAGRPGCGIVPIARGASAASIAAAASVRRRARRS